MRYLVILLFLIFSCSGVTPTQPKNEEFNPYLERFIFEARISKEEIDNKIHLEFHKYPDKSTVIGTCNLGVYKNVVWINIDWWNRRDVSDYKREAMVFHELGHCYLFRDHTFEIKNESSISSWFNELLVELGLKSDKKYLYDGCPISLMHPYVLSNRCYIDHYDYYMKELFRR
ncbi:MAG TPA: hypothetical protein VI911_11405 [Patescibacteria group bacterium]|nr:hypothetical protein [Patescibacteria group bacterium]